ncbi:unnamed protein product [Psylliodes chrysocephalus]|uniref:DUF4806 domain-containing protein n=1 Tax=Psylliodes chrysocephalus TaxID=3402493 RepID=A0A9P0GN26_9CUCU|nr:unnamed protein product [Psylliodes chrysocephala]
MRHICRVCFYLLYLLFTYYLIYLLFCKVKMERSWDIVVWTEENAIDYVPTSWANNTKTMYKYPLGKNSLKIKKLLDSGKPLNDENFHWLEAVCKAESVKDLQMAKDMCDRGQDTSNFELTESENGRKHRKPKRNSRILKCLSDSNSSEDSLPLPRGQNLIRKTFSSQPVICNKQTFNANNIPTNNSSQQMSSSVSRNSCTAVSRNCQPISRTSTPISINFEPDDVSSHTQTLTINDVNLMPTSSKVQQISTDLTPILEELTEIKYHMRETKAVLSRMEHFLNSSSNNPTNVTIPQTLNAILDLLPCETKEQLEKVDSLIHESRYMKELVNYLYLAGGDNPHKSAYLAMQKLFARQLAVYYSGQGKKKKIPFCNMKLYEAVFGAIRRRHPNVTDEGIKKSVSLFLATAKSRLTSKKNNGVVVDEMDLPDETDQF